MAKTFTFCLHSRVEFGTYVRIEIVGRISRSSSAKSTIASRGRFREHPTVLIVMRFRRPVVSEVGVEMVTWDNEKFGRKSV